MAEVCGRWRYFIAMPSVCGIIGVRRLALFAQGLIQPEEQPQNDQHGL
jgi:hypothetical protein